VTDERLGRFVGWVVGLDSRSSNLGKEIGLQKKLGLIIFGFEQTKKCQVLSSISPKMYFLRN
jgi:hypothetical protein